MVYWLVVLKAATKAFCVADVKVATMDKSSDVLLEPYGVVMLASQLDEEAVEK